MATKGTVNLDAMILRSDFAIQTNVSNDEPTFEKMSTIPARDLQKGSGVLALLRKPDFQRETNHWSPNQIVSLLECYVNGDLIPSIILWHSSENLFVIDGGHRLSVIRAWVEDDYGDKDVSMSYFGYNVAKEQKAAAEKTRKLVEKRVGSWATIQKYVSNPDLLKQLPANTQKQYRTAISRGLSIQWVSGDVEKAEASFFNINMKGTPLDKLEENLLKYRNKPIAIAARAIIRSGKGHKYWSKFETETSENIEKIASKIHTLLFDPELSSPIKTMDLPLSGSKGVRSALDILMLLLKISNLKQGEKLREDFESIPDDQDGSLTIEYLENLLSIATWITGNDKGIGLHPAVYFYGPTGRHSMPMFAGTFLLIKEKLLFNDKTFFRKFTDVRHVLENSLIENKDLISTILTKTVSSKRIEVYKNFLNKLINEIKNNNKQTVLPNEILEYSGISGSVFSGAGNLTESTKFSDEEKSKLFIFKAIKTALKCPICNGYIDVTKSVSYDHINRKRDGGLGTADNGDLLHPYCNQSIKN